MPSQRSKQVAILISDAAKAQFAVQNLVAAGVDCHVLREDLAKPSVLRRFDAVLVDYKWLSYVPEDCYKRVMYIFDPVTPEKYYDAIASEFIVTISNGTKLSLLVKIVTVALARSDALPSSENTRVVQRQTTFSCSGFIADFTAGNFSYNGAQVYLTRGEIDFLSRFANDEPHSSGHDRQRLYRMRKRFGREFLKTKTKDGSVASYE